MLCCLSDSFELSISLTSTRAPPRNSLVGNVFIITCYNLSLNLVIDRFRLVPRAAVRWMPNGDAGRKIRNIKEVYYMLENAAGLF